jgi:hypothetical protein
MSRVNLGPSDAMAALKRPLESPQDLFKAVPLGRRPNFGVGMAKGADQGRHLARCLDVLGAEYIQIIARS